MQYTIDGIDYTLYSNGSILMISTVKDNIINIYYDELTPPSAASIIHREFRLGRVTTGDNMIIIADIECNIIYSGPYIYSHEYLIDDILFAAIKADNIFTIIASYDDNIYTHVEYISTGSYVAFYKKTQAYDELFSRDATLSYPGEYCIRIHDDQYSVKLYTPCKF